MSTAPSSLEHRAHQRDLEATRSDLMTRTLFVEDTIRKIMGLTEDTKDFDAQWLAAARMDLAKGLMCLRRAIMRKDFF